MGREEEGGSGSRGREEEGANGCRGRRFTADSSLDLRVHRTRTAVGPTPRIKRANQISTVFLMQDEYTLHTAQEDQQIILPFSCRHGLNS
ncbi:unnamed protein product [Sphagnum jensenii]|uniref:Uncharacterized protein n=1 Tax=Sphagnum jensenii TaxID=128206 RepID=A0ABP1BC35_9BRYO